MEIGIPGVEGSMGIGLKDISRHGAISDPSFVRQGMTN
jgi:hypothetical protein